VLLIINDLVRFLPRDALLARYMPSSCVCVSVCVSVTLRCSIKMAKRMITQIMPHDSPGTVFSHAKDHGKIRRGPPHMGALNAGGVG